MHPFSDQLQPKSKYKTQPSYNSRLIPSLLQTKISMKYTKNPKIILIPYPAQGHVTPMQKLASIFHHHGFDPLIVLPQYIHNQIAVHTKPDDKIKWVPIPDGLAVDAVPDFFAIESAMENNMPASLEGLVHKFEEDGEVVCLVVDLLASWAIEVANRCGIAAAGFWPAMLATYRLVAAAPDMVRSGLISDTGLPQHEDKFGFLHGLPLISTGDLPWLIGTTAAKRARFKFWTRTLERSQSLKWLLVNSFPEESKLDKKTHLVTNCPKVYPQVFSIGPLGKHISTNNSSFWEEDVSCLTWLDTQRPNSVVYISFGSWVSPIGEAKVKSLALALEASKRPFIWVLTSTWREGLPNGFLETISKQGKVVSWVPQMAVLRHKSIGCYLTHCGWNSTMEAIQFKKRMLCYPVAGDQFVNCAYIVQVWRIGLKLQGLGEKEVKEGLRKVMEDKEIEGQLEKLSDRVMGMQNDSEGAINMNVFVEDLKKATFGFDCTHNIIVC